MPPGAGAGQFLDSLDREDGHSNLLHRVSSITPKDTTSYIRMLEFS